MRSIPKLLGSLSILLFSSLTVPSLQAATITPNITTDPALGSDAVNCSLRYAIESINDGVTFEGGCGTFSTGALGTDDTVVLGAGDYLLTLAGDEGANQTGDLDVLANVAILGAGPESTTIDASGISGGDRALELTDSTSEVSISGVTITGGDVNAIGNSNGGGILADVDGVLTIDNAHILDNSAGNGGGIYFDFDINALVNNVTVDGNDSGGCGGGIFLVTSTVGISNSTISNNESLDSDGGGICQFGDELFLANTTISTNTAAFDGGGISTEFETTGGIKGAYNVTIAFNQAGGSGGGIAGDVQVAPAGLPVFPTRIFNSIIARNTAVEGGNDCANGNFLTGGYNLIGEIGPNDNCQDFVNGVNGDQVGAPGSAIDPLLGPLQFNGGTTSGFTHALLVGSPAIDRGNPDGCQALDVAQFIDDGTQTFSDLTTDQRLLTRPVAVLDPNVPICDIGAYEFQVVEPTPTPTPSATPTPPPPPFAGFVEGSGCSLNPASAAAASGSLWIGLGLMAGFWGLKKKTRN